MKITEIELNNFRRFKKIQINFDERLNLIVGINGSGKTGILDALAILLSRLIGRIQSSHGTGRFFTDSDIQIGAVETVNTIAITYKRNSVGWKVTKTKKGRKKQTITNLEEIKEVVNLVQNELEKNADTNFPLAVYYSVHRAVLDIPLRIRTKHAFGQLEAYDQALTGARNDFRLFFEWFREREDLENEQRLSSGKSNIEYRDTQLQAVREAIEIFTGFSKIKISRNPLRMEVCKEGKIFNVGQLSDGEKCLFALVGDLARRLAIANPSLTRPLEGTGVILIDEIDLHLHPQWQQGVIGNLTTTFPNCQFIVTTHSPQVVTTVRAENIRVLTQVMEEGEDWQALIPEKSPLGHESGDALAFVMDTDPKPNIENISTLVHKYELLAKEGMKHSDEAQKIEEKLTEAGYQFNEADKALFDFLAKKRQGSNND